MYAFVLLFSVDFVLSKGKLKQFSYQLKLPTKEFIKVEHHAYVKKNYLKITKNRGLGGGGDGS